METRVDGADRRTVPGSAPVSRPPRVLVVEDEQDIAGLIKHALERTGEAQVEIVGSGDAALRAVTDQPPDLVILDLNLPVLSGTEVCRILRGRPATAATPISSSAASRSYRMASARRYECSSSRRARPRDYRSRPAPTSSVLTTS